jgi:hypothetical protein
MESIRRVEVVLVARMLATVPTDQTQHLVVLDLLLRELLPG